MNLIFELSSPDEKLTRGYGFRVYLRRQLCRKLSRSMNREKTDIDNYRSEKRGLSLPEDRIQGYIPNPQVTDPEPDGKRIEGQPTDCSVKNRATLMGYING